MASCKECLHYDVCEARIAADENYSERNYTENNNCSNFKDRTQFVELPCKVGNTVYFVIDEEIIKETITGFEIDKQGDLWINTHKYDYLLRDKFGETVFLSREEAERVLNSSEKPNS